MDNVLLPHIALIGKAGAGKSTAAEILQGVAGYTKLALATPLKEIAREIWGNDAVIDRDKLQKLGVAVREILPDSWINLLIEDIQRFRRIEPRTRIVVDDVRFPNEVQALLLEGFVFIRVHAHRNTRVMRLRSNGKLQDEAQLEHQSETAIDDFRGDYDVYNDVTRDRLAEQLVAILNKERR